MKSSKKNTFNVSVAQSLSESARHVLDALYEKKSDSLAREEVCPLFEELRHGSERYTISDELGHGAMKIVYGAHDAYGDRNVAFAVLKPEFGEDVFDSFLREARLTGRMEHPNVIKILDLGVKNQRPYFVMELKPGITLGAIISALSANETGLFAQLWVMHSSRRDSRRRSHRLHL